MQQSFAQQEKRRGNRTTWWLVAVALVATAMLPFVNGCAKSRQTIPENLSMAASYADGILTSGLREGWRHRQTLPGSLPSSNEELWIIARDDSSPAARDENSPGSGAMITTREDKEVPLPLKHTDVQASVLGYIATVKVTQQFHNPFDSKIEAKYVFPLPHNAAVNEFILTIGERRIRGIIRERKEAETIYAAAKSQGYVAALLTQERPNVFTQSIANIEPGKEIDVELNYFHTLEWADGWYEFVFPTVVGPRFNPPGTTNGIGAVERGSGTGVSPVRRDSRTPEHAESSPRSEGSLDRRDARPTTKTDVHYLKPTERSGHDIALKLDINAGVAIEETECATHVITKEAPSAEHVVVALSPNDRIPNKDFVFRFRAAGAQMKSGLLTSRDERGGFFTLMLYPPKDLKELARKPLELVFVLDSSGSMRGRPIAEAKKAIDRALRQLGPDDTFQMINFSTTASQLGPKPIAATPENVRRGLAHIEQLQGEGGTMMIEGIKAALDFPHDAERLRFVCFLTDGYIGNEADILAAIQQKLGATRIFSFGIGSSVNRYLMDHMAKVGRGAVAYLGPNDSAARIMDDFIGRIRHPALTDLQLDWGGATVTEVFPKRVPDLFVGRPVMLMGRFGSGTGVSPVQSDIQNGSSSRKELHVRITGEAGGKRVEWNVRASNSDQPRSLPSVWARMKIADLSDRALLDRSGELAGEIKQTALDFGLMSEFTAFVAVDSSRVTAGNEGTTVPVAVPVPDGVKHETTVQEK